jgi:hypothetical protein
MKIKLLLPLIIVLTIFSTQIFGQSAGDYVSKNNGNWSNTGTWSVLNTSTSWTEVSPASSAPPATANVYIRPGHTVTIDNLAATCQNLNVQNGGVLEYGVITAGRLTLTGDLIVETGAIFRTPSSVTQVNHSVTGVRNLVVDGTLDLNTTPTTGASITFAGASNNTITGSGAICRFYSLIVNKTALANTLEVLRPIILRTPTALPLPPTPQSLTITAGTFKLSSASTITPYYENTAISAAAGNLWLNHNACTVQSVNSATAYTSILAGGLRITAGTFNYGSGNDILAINSATSSLIIDGPDAVANILGGVNFSSTSKFSMTNGNLNIDPQASDNLASTSHILSFAAAGAASKAEFTGGKITIVDPHAATGTGLALYLSATTGTYNFNGGTIYLGNGTSTSAGSADGFDINTGTSASTYVIGNLEVNSAAGGTNRFARLAAASTIGGNLTINANNDFSLNGLNLNLRGNLENNGTFSSATAASMLSMTGTAAQTISGFGTFTASGPGQLLRLTMNNSSGLTPAVDLQVPLTITNSASPGLILSKGSLGTTNSSVLTLGLLGVPFTTTRSSGELVLIPTIAEQSNYNVTYTGGVGITTGKELPTSLNNLLINTNLTNVTLNNSVTNLTILGMLTMSNTSVFNYSTTTTQNIDVKGNFAARTFNMAGTQTHTLKLFGLTNTCTTLGAANSPNSIIEYYGTVAQTVFTSPNYQNVLITGTGVKTIAPSTTGSTIKGNLTIDGVLQFSNSTTALRINGDATINPSGTFRVVDSPTTNYGHTINLYGNCINNGILDFYKMGVTSYSQVNINVYGNNKNFDFGVGSVTDLFRITLNNGATNQFNFNAHNTSLTVNDGTSLGFLYITSGIFHLTSDGIYSNPVFTAPAYTIPAAGHFWLDNPNFTVTGQNGNATVNGKLQITQGIYNIGIAATNNLGFGTGGTLNIESNAILNIPGYIYSGNAMNYIQTGGNVNVSTIYPTVTTGYSINLNSVNNKITFTGGTINIVNSSINNGAYYFNSSLANANLNGTGVLNLGTSASTSTVFNIAGFAPQLNVNEGMFSTLVGATTLYRDLVVKDEATFSFASSNLTFAGTADQNINIADPNHLTSVAGTLTVNKPSGEVNANLSLVVNSLNMTKGVYNSSATNLLAVYGATAANVTAANNAYVRGPLQRRFTRNQSGVFLFPVGKTQDNTFSLVSGATTGNINDYGFITVESFDSNTGGTAGSGIEPGSLGNRYWDVHSDMNTVAFPTSAKIRLKQNSFTPGQGIGQSNTFAGAYNTRGGATLGDYIESTVALDFTNINNSTNAHTYFTLGEIVSLSGVYVSGNFSVPFTNLTDISNILRQYKVIGDVTFIMSPGYIGTVTYGEIFPIVFDQFATSSPSHKVTIRLADGSTGRLTTGNSSTPALIRFNGVDNLSIDGQGRDAGGNLTGIREWTFRPTSASYPTFLIENDATNNSLTYLNIEGNATSINSATILIGATSYETGNDDNSITYCNIGGRTDVSQYSANAINSPGTSGRPNNHNTVSNCLIHDYFVTNTHSNGLALNANNSDWIITDNKFYQSVARSYTTASDHRAIIILGGTNYIVTGNTIGFATATNTGTYTMNNAPASFTGIYGAFANTGTNRIQNNLISNISLTTTQGTNATTGVFCGIYHPSGSATISDNSIGSGSATNAITVTPGNGAYTSGIISISAGTVQIENNTIAGINIAGASATVATGFQGIKSSGTGIYTINANKIGSSTLANSISQGTTGLTTENGTFYGIWNSAKGALSIQNNSIGNITLNTTAGTLALKGIYNNPGGAVITNINSNVLSHIEALCSANGEATIEGILHSSGASSTLSLNNNKLSQFRATSTTGNTTVDGIINSSIPVAVSLSGNSLKGFMATGTGTAGYIRGICSTEGIHTVTNNRISEFANNSPKENKDHIPSLSGIVITSTSGNQSISHNVVHSLENNTPGPDYFYVYGIYLLTNGNSNSIDHNMIHSVGTTSDKARQIAIHVASEIVNASLSLNNNVIRLGRKADGSEVTSGDRFMGINNLTSANTNLYHNSILICGTSSSPCESYAYYHEQCTVDDNRNNIFANTRSGTGSHYAYFLGNASSVRSDYNIYCINSAGGGYVSNINGNNRQTMQAHRFTMPFYNGSAQDLHSGYNSTGNLSYLFAKPTDGAATIDLHLSPISSAEGTGTVIATITSDYEDADRSLFSPIDIGAYSGNSTFNADADIFTPCFLYNGLIANTSSFTADQSITIRIIDKTGINNTTNPPRLYYRRASTLPSGREIGWDPSNFAAGSLKTGTQQDGEWIFTIDVDQALNLLPSEQKDNDIIEYYFVAQDEATTPNVWYSHFDDISPVHSPNVAGSTTLTFPGAYPVFSYAVGGNWPDPITIGTLGTFATLTGINGFFQSLSTLPVNKDITATIISDITEPGTYALKRWTETAGGPYTVNIVPDGTTERVLTCNNPKDMIRLDSANRASFDGSIAGAGRYLKFVSTQAGYAVFEFLNNANTNAIKNCKIQGKTAGVPKGLIWFAGSGGKNPVDGNNNNLISGNELTNTGIVDNCILSIGSIPAVNYANTITGNTISNFSNCGIWVHQNGNGDGWAINDNSLFYNTAVNPNPLSDIHTGISVQAGDKQSINRNYIGGQAAGCSGLAWTNTANAGFRGLALHFSTSGSGATVTDNVVSNINLPTTAYNADFAGIYVSDGKIARMTGNLIGSLTNADDIQTADGPIVGIAITSTVAGANVSANTISNITTSTPKEFKAMALNISGAGSTRLNGNLIQDINTTTTFTGIEFSGSSTSIANIGSTTANTINNIQNAGSGNTWGINISGTGSHIVNNTIISNFTLPNATLCKAIAISNGALNNNQITNFNLTSTGASSFTGIDCSGSTNIGTTTGNTISIIHFDGTGAVNGINTSNTSNISNNIVTGFDVSNATTFKGIAMSAGTLNINANTIKDIELTSTGNSAFHGIFASGGTLNIGLTSGNIIGTSAEPITTAGTGNTSGISVTGTSSIRNNTISYITANGASAVYGINAASANSVQSNIIGPLYVTNTGASSFTGIRVGSAITTITQNTIGNGTTVAGTGGTNLINYVTATAGTAFISSNTISGVTNYNNSPLKAIDISATTALPVVEVLDNKISALTNSGTGINTSFTGINYGSLGKTLIRRNTIGDPLTAHSLYNSGAGPFIAINVSSPNAGSEITENVISNLTQAGDNYLAGINVPLANDTVALLMDNNTIKSLSNTNTGANASIKPILAGNANKCLFAVTANKISNLFQTSNNPCNAIDINLSSAGNIVSSNLIADINTVSGEFCGIKAIAGNTRKNLIDWNTIKGIIINNSSSSSFGIKLPSGNWTLSDIASNTIGDATTSNSILTNGRFTGIYSASADTINIKSNLIANITSSGSNLAQTAGNTLLAGIHFTKGICHHNTVHNLSATNTGIWHIAGISSNTISNSSISENRIYNFSSGSSDPSSSANGILLNASSANALVYNNQITLGSGQSTPAYHGVWINEAGSGNANIYFNTIYLSGSGAGESFGILRENVATTVDIQNNILVNDRSGVNHYSIGNKGSASQWTSNHNDLTNQNTVSHNMAGYWNGTSYNFENWKTNTQQDTNSVSYPPVFTDPTPVANCNFNIDPANNCKLNGRGISIVGITTDYDGNIRAVAPMRPDIGAFELTPSGTPNEDEWTGYVDSDWRNKNNWGCEIDPTAIPTLIIPWVSTNNPVITTTTTPVSSSGVVANNLIIRPGGNLTVAPDAYLQTNGDFTIGGAFVLQSNITGTASLITNGGLSQTGRSRMELYFEGNQYHYISSPMNNVNAGSVAGSDHYYSYNEANADIVTKKDWMKGWEKVNPADILGIAKGYALYYGITAKFNFAGGIFNNNEPSFNLTWHNDNWGSAIYDASGWNLVGNPYPAAIDADKFIDANIHCIDGALYFWTYNGNIGWNLDGSDYACYTKVGSVVSVKNTHGSAIAPSMSISQGQGFFVKKLAPLSVSGQVDNIVFTKDMRTVSHANFYKNDKDIQRLYISITSDTLYNQTLLAFTNDATMKYDNGYDAIKLRGNTKLALYSLTEAKECIIQAQPKVLDEDRVIPLGFETKVTGELSINLESLEKIEPSLNIYLIDKLANKLINLKKQKAYTFYSEQGVFQNRFKVVFTAKDMEETTHLLAGEIKVYANDRQVIVELPASAKEGGQVRIFDLLGNQVLSRPFADEYLLTIPLNVRGGIYLVEVKTGESSKTGKVYINQ